MTEELTLDLVKQAVGGRASAFRRKLILQPAGGAGDKIFPSTYEGGAYAMEQRRIESALVECVLLDSVQSQANRMEAALLDAWRSHTISLPMVEVDFSQSAAPEVGRLTVLETPHRIADAILRDSQLGGTRFRESEVGKRLDQVSARNARVLFELCPTALLFGMWDSTGPRGGLGAKFARAIVSEIVGIGAVKGVRTSSRIDPLQILKIAGPVYRTGDGDWTLEAKSERGGKVKVDPGQRPSEVNHGNIPPTIGEGGVTIQYAEQRTVLSLPALRRFRFRADSSGKVAPEDHAAWTVLAALGLCAATLATENGYDLRSRCHLVPTSLAPWELLATTEEDPQAFRLTAAGAIELLNAAVAEAQTAGLPWNETPITLTPKNDLARLVRKSFDMAGKTGDLEEV